MCRRQHACNDYQEEKDSMRRTALAATAVLALGLAQLNAVPALAQYGAIAWDKATGKYGASWNQETSKRAEEVALSDCSATGCKVTIRTRRTMCAALATNENGKFAGGASRRDREAARLSALTNCKKGNAGECTVRVTDCNK
jgi:hypothetical protein